MLGTLQVVRPTSLWLLGLSTVVTALVQGPGAAAAAPRSYRLSVGQVRLTDPADVLKQIERIMRQSGRSELVVFAEFVTHGDAVNLDEIGTLKEDPEARATAAKWISLTPTFGAVKQLADRYKKAIVVGCLEQQDQELRSRAYFYDPLEKELLHYDKTHVHWTEKLLRPGDDLAPVDTRFGRLGFLICYDLAFVEPTRVLGLAGAEVLIVISAVPKHFSWQYVERRAVGAAIFNQYYVVTANQGNSAGSPMGGHSAIFDPKGAQIAHLRSLGTGQIAADVDLAAVKAWRAEEVIDRYRRPELYRPLAATKH